MAISQALWEAQKAAYEKNNTIKNAYSTALKSGQTTYDSYVKGVAAAPMTPEQQAINSSIAANAGYTTQSGGSIQNTPAQAAQIISNAPTAVSTPTITGEYKPNGLSPFGNTASYKAAIPNINERAAAIGVTPDEYANTAYQAQANGMTVEQYYRYLDPTNPKYQVKPVVTAPAQSTNPTVMGQTVQPTADDLFSGIVSGKYTPDKTNPQWTSMYQNGSATPAQVEAYNRWTAANALVDQIKAGKLAPSQTNPQWTAMYQNGQPTQAQKDAYALWDNLVKTGKVQTSALGIPTTISGGTAPTVGSTINVSDMKNANQGYIDLKNMLGVSINGDGLLDGIDSQTAGLLALLGQTTEADKEVQRVQNELLASMKMLGGEAADIQSEMTAQGVYSAYDQVKQLSLKAAQLQGEIEKFDVESIQGNETIGNRPIPGMFVTGQQAAYNRQRAIDKMAKTAELSAVIALQQAYKGNAELGIELAQKSVDLKYQPILNQIQTLQTQLGFATENATKKDAARMDVIKSLLQMKQESIQQEKQQQMDIQKIAIEAAMNGAPLSVVNDMKSASDPATAASIGASYLKGNFENTPDTAGSVYTGGSVGNVSVSAGTTQNRPDRNNNPLNIKVPSGGIEVARQRYNDPGATIDPVPATDGGQFIKFSDPNVGVQAAITLLRMGYQDLEFGAAMKRWSGGGYGAEIAPQYAGKKVRDLTDSELADVVVRMAKREGFTGKVSFGGGTSNTINGVSMTNIDSKAKNDLIDDLEYFAAAPSRDDALMELNNNITTYRAKYGDDGVEVLRREIDKKFPPSNSYGPDIMINDIYNSLFK